MSALALKKERGADPPGERRRFSGLENPRKREDSDRAGVDTIRQNPHGKQGAAPCWAC
jgi:hypothetical protein